MATSIAQKTAIIGGFKQVRPKHINYKRRRIYFKTLSFKNGNLYEMKDNECLLQSCIGVQIIPLT